MPSGTLYRRRVPSTRTGTGFPSPYAQVVPVRKRPHPAARNVPGDVPVYVAGGVASDVSAASRLGRFGRNSVEPASVSGFISAAVARVQREDDLAQLLDDLDRELGPVDDADLAWADKALGLA